MSKKCIIIPAFNEDKNIEIVIKGIRQYTNADIIVIDDGSKDDTAKKAKQAQAIVLKHPFNMGYGTALQTGYKYAVAKNYDFLLQMDADQQHLPEAIPKFFDQIETRQYDILIGSRFIEKDQYKTGLIKDIGIKLFRYIVLVITKQKITDPTSGYQCMNKKVFTLFTEDSFPCDYPDANIIIMLHRLGFKIKEISVKMIQHPTGKAMHTGILKISYYIFKVFLSIFITLIRKKSYYLKETTND